MTLAELMEIKLPVEFWILLFFVIVLPLFLLGISFWIFLIWWVKTAELRWKRKNEIVLQNFQNERRESDDRVALHVRLEDRLDKIKYLLEELLRFNKK